MKIAAGILCLLGFVWVITAFGWVSSRLGNLGSKAPACLEVLGSTTSEEDGVTYIVGSLRNTCETKFSQVTVLFKLDRVPGPMEGMSEGSAYAYSRDVEPGDVRQFKSAIPVSKDSSYRPDGISAY